MSIPVEIEKRLAELEAQIARSGAELVEILYRRSGQRSVLTFLVDKKGGITLEECAEVNRRLGAYFDQLAEIGPLEAGFLQGSYFLEVNSPGLDRPLKTPKDFQRVLGETLRVQTRDERGTVHTLIGRLTGLTELGIEIENGPGAAHSLGFDGIFRATRDVSLKNRG